MSFPKQIETERLLLRWPTRSDADEMFARYANDAEVARYLRWRPHRSVRETIEFLQRTAGGGDEDGEYAWLIYPRAGGSLLGSVGCHPQDHAVEIGYCLARDAWGQGFATEAAQAVVDCAFKDESVWRVQATCDVENVASARVLEKLGLVYEGTLRRYIVLPNLADAPRDMLLYALVRGDALTRLG